MNINRLLIMMKYSIDKELDRLILNYTKEILGFVYVKYNNIIRRDT